MSAKYVVIVVCQKNEAKADFRAFEVVFRCFDTNFDNIIYVNFN